jgi:hypothetical protein
MEAAGVPKPADYRLTPALQPARNRPAAKTFRLCR